MPIAVICTGTELLKGSCCNTNMQLLGAKLTANALPPVMELSIGDHAGVLCFALGCALKCADTLVISGGLGPTCDDITLHTVSTFFGVETVEVPELKEKVKNIWEMRHSGHCPKFQYKQALIVKGGRYFDNPAGTASGIAFDTVYGGKMRHICLIPGPPGEFETVLDNGMLEHLIKMEGKELYTTGFLVVSAGESFVARHAEEMFRDWQLELAYTAVPAGTKIFFSGSDRELLDSACEKARGFFGRNALEAGVFDLPSALLKKLREKKLTFGCAESCTGGLVADSMVSLPGASEVFLGGIISYANSAKENILHVPAEVLQTYGAVSTQCAEFMAQGAAKALNCRCAVSTTGIAGPGGGTPEKPVGTVCIAAVADHLTISRQLQLRGNRRMIRERAAAAALALLLELLDMPENNQC